MNLNNDYGQKMAIEHMDKCPYTDEVLKDIWMQGFLEATKGIYAILETVRQLEDTRNGKE